MLSKTTTDIEDTYTVTEVGTFASSIQMGVQNAYMVYLATKAFELDQDSIALRTIIVVASMIDVYGPSFFFVPRRERFESSSDYQSRRNEHITQYHERFRGKTDIHTLVNIYWSLMLETAHMRGSFMHSVLDWSKENKMNNKKLKEFLSSYQSVESSVERTLKIKIDKSEYADAGLLELGDLVADVFSKAYQHNKFTKRGHGVSYVEVGSQTLYYVNRNASFNTIDMRGDTAPREIVAANTVEIVTQEGVRNLFSLFVPTTKGSYKV
jgi:hypothetical protein